MLQDTGFVTENSVRLEGNYTKIILAQPKTNLRLDIWKKSVWGRSQGGQILKTSALTY